MTAPCKITAERFVTPAFRSKSFGFPFLPPFFTFFPLEQGFFSTWPDERLFSLGRNSFEKNNDSGRSQDEAGGSGYPGLRNLPSRGHVTGKALRH
jgi:hypothetical protein